MAIFDRMLKDMAADGIRSKESLFIDEITEFTNPEVDQETGIFKGQEPASIAADFRYLYRFFRYETNGKLALERIEKKIAHLDEQVAEANEALHDAVQKFNEPDGLCRPVDPVRPDLTENELIARQWITEQWLDIYKLASHDVRERMLSSMYNIDHNKLGELVSPLTTGIKQK